MSDPQRPQMSASTSLVLDALRLVAALVVVVFHVSSQWTSAYPAMHEVLGKAAHAAVILFFVISGYVIAFTSAGHDRGPRQYAVARLSRLYSMLLPALLLTVLVEVMVMKYDALLVARYVREHSWLRYGLTAVFCNESGNLSAAPPLNSPLWSLSYEFWYYTLFGLWHYRAKNRLALIGIAAASFVAGPKILLMLPIWLGGVLAFRWPKPGFVAKNTWPLVGLFLVLAEAAGLCLPALPGELGAPPLYLAAQFATDWVVGTLVALAVWSLPMAAPMAAPALTAAAWAKPFRNAANLSFPLYVLHFPLIVLWRVAFGNRMNDLTQMGQAALSVSLVAGLLGVLLERQRHHWVRLFEGFSHLPGTKRPAGKR